MGMLGLVLVGPHIEFLQLAFQTLRHSQVEAMGRILAFSDQIERIKSVLNYWWHTCKEDFLIVPACDRV